MNAYERLLKSVVIRTPSNEESETTPSAQCQFDLANVLKKEMEELGICDVTLTDTHAFCMERFRQLQDVKMHLQLVLLHIWIRFQIIVTMI